MLQFIDAAQRDLIIKDPERDPNSMDMLTEINEHEISAT